MSERGVGDHRYEAEIRWTTHGVPHIRAGSWGDLGFGQGWSCAADRFATIADHVLKVRSERARHLGAGPDDRHLHSDLGYRALEVLARAERMLQSQPPEIRDLVAGYAAGCNAWLAEIGREGLPTWCRDATWIGPVSEVDLAALYVDLALMGSARNLVTYIGSATPPGAEGPAPPPPVPPGGEVVGEPELGSNGWAFGSEVTATGGGLLVANPHFPWYGEGKLWECHLQLPGELDVYGAALVGTPGVQIGFNDRLAWTHTFSRGHRFTVATLALAPGEPTRCRVGDRWRDLVPTEHRVGVLGADGEVRELTTTLWSSHHGPMLNLPFVGWTEDLGFTFRDANLDNDRFLQQVLAIDRAGSVPELEEAFARHGGLPWVNTLAADSEGRCWYIDSSATPNLSEEAQRRYRQAVDEDPVTALMHTLRVALLDGSDPGDDWVDEPGAPAPGLVPVARLPQLRCRDHLFNANDPYWLPHPTVQLAPHSPMHGLHRARLSARTRMNARLVAGRPPATRSAPGGRLTAEDAVAALLGNHSLLALELLDDVLARLGGVESAEVDGRRWDLRPAVATLRSWDRIFDVGSVGAVLWRELLAGFDEEAVADAGPLWAEPWDPDDPVDTPRGLAPAPPEGPDPLVVALCRALAALETAGIRADAPLGSCQWADRGGARHPLPGGGELEGVANVLAPLGALDRADLDPGPPALADVAGRSDRSGLHVGGYRVTYGASFVMVVSFEEGGPRATGLLVYGQSDDPTSPHHSDQLDPFARGELRDLRRDDVGIVSDPQLVTRLVSG